MLHEIEDRPGGEARASRTLRGGNIAIRMRKPRRVEAAKRSENSGRAASGDADGEGVPIGQATAVGAELDRAVALP